MSASGIKFILWIAHFIAAGAGLNPACARFRALCAAVSEPGRAQRDPVADLDDARDGGPIRADRADRRVHGPRYDVIIPPSGDLAAVRDIEGQA